MRRVRQFARAMLAQARLARIRDAEYATVDTHLSPAQAALFRRMDRPDQRHCLDVFYSLHRMGYREDSLLEAALLHDVGKSVRAGGTHAGHTRGGRLTVWHRVAVVLMQQLAPRRLSSLASDGQSWKAPFAVHVRHAETSAQRAAEVGCSPTVVALIREHHAPDPENDLLAALQWADDQN